MADEPIINAPLRTLADGNMDVFRYGLFKYDDSNYEDPTYLGFTIEIDESSALFNDVLPFLEQRGTTRAELNARIPVYKEFVNKIVQIFKSQESVEDPSQQSIYIKQHYINSISGLDGLSKKFNRWREDKLTFELHEDITLFSSYIANLYNNLVYSYENGRQMIPENLLKFNLHIKISEIRNLTSIAKLKSNDPIDQRIVDGLKNNITCLTYTLYDCEFDFFNSKPFGDTISQAGIDTAMPGHSVIGFDIFYKSVSRNVFNPLVRNALAMNDNIVDLGIVILNTDGIRNTNGQVIDDSGVAVGVNGEAYQESVIDGGSVRRTFSFPNDTRKPSALSTYATETATRTDLITTFDLTEQEQQRQDMIAYNIELAPDIYENKATQFDPLKPEGAGTLIDRVVGKDLTNIVKDPQAALNGLTNTIKSKVENTVKDGLKKAETLLKQKRNALVKSFVNDLEQKAGLKKIIPANVNDDPNYYKNLLDQLKSDVGLSVGDALINAITHN